MTQVVRSVGVTMCSLQVLTFGWREDIRVGDPMHTRKVCFDAISHNSPVTLFDCHGMKGNQLWRYRKVLERKEETEFGVILLVEICGIYCCILFSAFTLFCLCDFFGQLSII